MSLRPPAHGKTSCVERVSSRLDFVLRAGQTGASEEEYVPPWVEKARAEAKAREKVRQAERAYKESRDKYWDDLQREAEVRAANERADNEKRREDAKREQETRRARASEAADAMRKEWAREDEEMRAARDRDDEASAARDRYARARTEVRAAKERADNEKRREDAETAERMRRAKEDAQTAEMMRKIREVPIMDVPLPPGGAIPQDGRQGKWSKASVSSLWSILVEKKTAAYRRDYGRDPTTEEQQSWEITRLQLISALKSHPDLKASLGLLPGMNINESGGVRNLNYVARLMDALQHTDKSYKGSAVTYIMWLKLLGAGVTPINLLAGLPTAALVQYVCAVLDNLHVEL